MKPSSSMSDGVVAGVSSGTSDGTVSDGTVGSVVGGGLTATSEVAVGVGSETAGTGIGSALRTGSRSW